MNLLRKLLHWLGLFESSRRKEQTDGDGDTTEIDDEPWEGDEYWIQRKEFDAWDWEKSDKYPFAHYTNAVENIKQLKREGRHAEVEELLLWCIEYVEAEAEVNPTPTIAPWYYEHLGIVYRKDRRHEDEVEVLERYIAATETTGRAPRDKILGRLAKAQALVVRS